MNASALLWERRKPRRAAHILAICLASFATAACAAAPDESAASRPGTGYASCRIDADCAIKNVGNCCGYFPACVNKDSPTDPERVRAECEAKGLASTCGFAEIASCACVDGRCAAAPGDSGDVR